MRSKRKRQPTPKGEAARSLEHTQELLKKLEGLNRPGEKQAFVRRLNDFLRSARTVVTFLPKESGRSSGLKAWAETEIENVRKSDGRFDHFFTLRTVSEHDCLVEPDRGAISVETTDQLSMSGSCEGALRDTSGNVVARVSSSAPPGEGVSVSSTKVSTKYFFSGWPREDIVSFCNAVVATLASLVDRAYQLYP